MKIYYLYFVLFLLVGCSTKESESPKVTEAFLEKRLSELANRAITDLEKVSIDSMSIPRALNADGSLHGTKSREWTSGFYPGTLWQLYRFGGQEELKTAAEKWTDFEEKEKWDTHTHDLGFKIYCSFGEGLEATQLERYKEVILDASKTLVKRYNPTVGAIRSWDWNTDIWQFPVIIDNMMNLKMLFVATELSGDSTFYKIARQHALTTMDHHFRSNYSSYHVIDYDTLTGEVRNRHTHQGAANESSWSRGQAWGLYGFAMAYGFTKDQRFLDQAKAIANFIFHHPRLPEDYIPYWDFDAPNIPDEPRDVSAATVAASGLLELCQYDPANRKQYVEWVDHILLSLNEANYQTEAAPFLLGHSVGSIPGEFEIDVPIVYADYYYVEALLRRMKLEQALALHSN